MTIQEMQIVEPVVNKLLEIKLPIQKAYQVYSLAKDIENARDFATKEVQKLVEKYDVEVLGNGELKIENEENREKFIEEYNKLMQYDVIHKGKYPITLEDFGNAEFTAREVAALELIFHVEESCER